MSIPDPENFIAVQARLELPLVRALDDYRRTLPELRPRSEIVRMFIARSLGMEPEPRALSGLPLRRRPDAMNRPNPPRKRGRPPKRRPEAEQPAA